MPDQSPAPRLIARTAFGADHPCVETIGPWTLIECPNRAIASVTARQGYEDAVAATLATLASGPVDLGTLRNGPSVDVFGTALQQWFVTADHTEQEHLARTLADDLGMTASVTEQNDGWVVFTLQGDGVIRVLERLVMTDLQALSNGSAQRLLLEHMNVFLLCREQDQAYDILVARSFALSLHHAVTTAMRSVAALSTMS
ncbi:sarcosine oxidase subunit gamma [Epibacterium sp. MM17-32]|uniref:sarcosine oxidase subunit gamma n=1 Tax=Epibacterium sp. MM17-32 TaxID=2917734 RepID=UPI001EF5705D|nr:sarcosine oxidase subunit gamma [Epibacterium sp. MM17-32]MCG7629890.1 sarcosine oxidase subunit gamma [Epibacterium sp. MM17-32]